MLRKSDLWWLLGYPVYQLIGTLRHEASHALVAVMEGAHIEHFAWLPSYLPDKGFTWGYVRWYGETDWLAIAAPYFVDLLTYLLFYLICTRLHFRRHWLWLNLVILGMISPLANSLYNYARAGSPRSDVGRLLATQPPMMVHAYFVITLVLYAIGLWRVFRRPQLVENRETLEHA